MGAITLNDITSGYNISRINYNFEILEEVVNNQVLHTEGGLNTMNQDLDMNSYSILNAKTNVNDPGSMVTLGFADERYVNTAGDTMSGQLSMGNNKLTGLPVPVGVTDAVRKIDLDTERQERLATDQALFEGYTSADANLQSQITGSVPLEASAFSVISWHDQSVDNSVSIPAGKNAWSFGPTITISLGQVVTIGDGSFWTIANGEVV